MDPTAPYDPDPSSTVIRVETYRLTRVVADEPELVEVALKRLLNRITHWARRNGYVVIGNRTEVHPEITLDTVRLHMEGFCRPRTDGEWPSLHKAIREDEHDRELLRGAERLPPGSPSPWTGDPF